MEEGNGKKKAKAGMWLVWFGILAIPARLIGATVGASQAGCAFHIRPDELLMWVIASAILIGIGASINLWQRRKERRAEGAPADTTNDSIHPTPQRQDAPKEKRPSRWHSIFKKPFTLYWLLGMAVALLFVCGFFIANSASDSAFRTGRSEGYKEGYGDGQSKGYSSGYAEGRKDYDIGAMIDRYIQTGDFDVIEYSKIIDLEGKIKDFQRINEGQ